MSTCGCRVTNLVDCQEEHTIEHSPCHSEAAVLKLEARVKALEQENRKMRAAVVLSLMEATKR